MKLIKKAQVEEKQVEFNVGNKVKIGQYFHDGRIGDWEYFYGNVVKVNKVTIDVEFQNGDVYRVNKTEAKVI